MSSTTAPGITSPTKQSPTSNLKPNRLPAPTLFVGPPSRNASQLSVARPGLAREKSARSRIHTQNANAEDNEPSRELPTLRKPSEKSVDAKWREMQSTLNEVELTAQSSTRVFGESHAQALEDLRNAQIALAKAWGRGNDTQAAASGEDGLEFIHLNRFNGAEEMAVERGKTTGMTRKRADTQASASTTLSDESQLTEDSVSGRSQMEDETAQDIKLAGERRAANEEYFKKVDQGVKEVVEKLDKVAEAMRGVEVESRSLWSNSSSGDDEGRRVVTAPTMPSG